MFATSDEATSQLILFGGMGNNTATGLNALFGNTGGSANTAQGAYALQANIGGFGNTANGYYALYANISGSNNIALGYQAGQAILTSSNIDIGNAGFAACRQVGQCRRSRVGEDRQAAQASISYGSDCRRQGCKRDWRIAAKSGIDRKRRAVPVDELGAAPGAGDEVAHPRSGRADVRRVRGLGADRRNRQELGQLAEPVAPHRGPSLAAPRAQATSRSVCVSANRPSFLA